MTTPNPSKPPEETPTPSTDWQQSYMALYDSLVAELSKAQEFDALARTVLEKILRQAAQRGSRPS